MMALGYKPRPPNRLSRWATARGVIPLLCLFVVVNINFVWMPVLERTTRGAATVTINAIHPLKLWAGEAMRHPAVTIKAVYVVLTYCKADLSWMKEDVFDHLPRNAEIRMTIYSKCGNEDKLVDYFQDDRITVLDVLSLPNYGGNEHGNAYFIHHVFQKKEQIDPTAVYLFLKDTPRTRTYFQINVTHSDYRSIADMMHIAQSDFICAVKTFCELSPYHETAILGDFQLKNYIRQSERIKMNQTEIGRFKKLQEPDFNPLGYENLRDFQLRALNYSNPNPLTEVCYTSVFAVPGARLKELSQDASVVQIFERMVQNLSRNTSITIEEHFSERTVGGLLAYPLSTNETEILRKLATRGTLRHTDGVYGALWAQREDFCEQQQQRGF